MQGRCISDSIELPSKKRKIDLTSTTNTSADSDTLDPVEKLLSFANRNDDFLNTEENQHEDYNEPLPKNQKIAKSTNIILDDNLKLYYAQQRQKNNDNNNSSFSILNKSTSSSSSSSYSHSHSHSHSHNNFNSKSSAVPFFRTVNFNPKPSSSAYTFDEYLSYDEEEDDEESQSDSSSSPITPTMKFNVLAEKPTKATPMSFHYRHNDNLNLSLHNSHSEPLDVFKALNKRSILNGKASEMVSTGNLLIHDFFL